MAIQCIVSLMDIFPSHVNHFVQHGVVQALYETMEQSMGFVDLAEQCIKCCEKVSQENPREILKSGILLLSLNMIDFFDKSTQIKILQLLLNVSAHSESDSDFTKNLLPIVPNICQMLSSGISSEQDRIKFEKLSTVVARISKSFTMILNPIDNFEQVAGLFEKLSDAGLHEAIYECICTFSNYVFATKSGKPQGQDNQSQTLISTDQSSGQQTFTDSTICNFLSFLQISCQYSQQVVMQLTSAGIFDILEQLLPSEQKDDHSQVVSDVLGLLSNMFPVSEAISAEETKAMVFETGFGQKIVIAEYGEERLAKFNEVRGKIESEKENFFKSQDPALHSQLSKSLLPKIFSAYIQNINNDFRTKCLTLIQRTLRVIPKTLLNESFDPASFTKFIHMILRTHQPQQVLYCMKMILQMLESDFGAQLSIYFIRHGIRETIKDYTLPSTIEKLNDFEVQPANQHETSGIGKYSSKASYMQLATTVERERLAHRSLVIQNLMESSTGAKREELARVLVKYEETLKMLEAKNNDLQKEANDVKESEKEKQKQKTKFGQVISELALTIQSKYIDNESYWATISAQHPNEVNFQNVLHKLAADLISDAQSQNFNFVTSQKLMLQLAAVLTSPLGLTNFEFENSGLLKAITVFLTMSPYDARLISEDKNEETKQGTNEKHDITKQEAISLIMRLRLFAQAMCTRVDNKLPFKCLLNVCHEQLTLAEPIIFKDSNQDYQGQLDALNHLSKGIIINLVYDPEGKNCGNAEPDQPALLKAKSMGLPFQNLQADTQKSILFHKRHALYEKLKQVPLNIQQCDNVLCLEDFLLKRIRSKEDVQQLIDQTRPGGLFGRHAKEQSEENEESQDKQLSPVLQEVFDRCMERIVEFIEECVDQGMFGELCPAVIAELVSFIEDSPEIPEESFYSALEEDVTNLIKEMAAEEQAELSDEEMNEGEESRELVMAEIVQAKTQAFMDLIRIVKEQIDSQKTKKATGDVVMEDLLAKSEEQVSESATPLQNSNSEDIEMTEENPGQELKSSSQSAEMSDLPIDPVPQKLQATSTQPMKAAKPIRVTKDSEDSSANIAELLKQNNGQDIQILFFNNKTQIDKTTSFYEICKEPVSAENKSEVPQQIKDLMAQLTGGFLPGQRTIYFQIKDCQPVVQTSLSLQRKDSLYEYSQLRQRTKSQFVDEISASSINYLVQSLIQHEFGIQGFNKSSGDESSQTLEQTLKVMKVLHFIFTNAYMFTQQGVNFLLHRSIEQTNQTIQDLELTNLLSEVRLGNFNHPKLDSNLQKAIQDPYKLVSGGLKEVLKAIFSSCSFLFNFETKQLYLRLVSFISVDLQRSMFYLRQHMKKSGRLQQQKQSQLGSVLEREERQPKISRQRIKVDRSNLIEQALNCTKDLQKRAFLEIQFNGEEGTGLGPTLEFYNLLSEQLKADETLWRKKTVDGVLYPKSLSPKDNVKEICEKFHLAGLFVARSITDDRLMDLPISQLMWDILLQKKKNLFDLKKLDKGLFEIFSDLQLMANRKQEIDEMHVDQEMKQRLYAQVKSSKGAKIEDYDLYFYDPADEHVELVKDGKTTSVTLHNLQEYIDLVLDSTFNESVRLQIAAFKKGFNQVMPVETLRIFQHSNELETLICGEATISAYESEWTNAARLSELIVTAHGYHQKSRAFKDFLRYLNELTPKDRSLFLSFITGSPRLPVGGFGALEPRMTVVLKKPLNPSDNPDNVLPSVMTCQNYLKMPDYTTYEVLKQRFDYAIQEGKGNFTLS